MVEGMLSTDGNLPFSLYLFRRAASEQWLSRRAL